MKRSESYDRYKDARDKAWDTLVRCGVHSLPVNIRALCRQLHVQLFTYSKDAALIEAFRLTEYTSSEGFCTTLWGKYAIFLDSSVQPKSRLYFTAAHELGHIALGHLRRGSAACGRGTATVWNRGEEEPPNPYEVQANVFASRLLAPACVLYELDVRTVEEMMTLTGLSRTAAAIRLERLSVLRKRGRFYLHPLEASLRTQFSSFISAYKPPT